MDSEWIPELPKEVFDGLPPMVQAYIRYLEHRVEKLEENVSRLEARVLELEKDSSNSNKPPSSDGLGKRTIAGSQRKKSGKKPGAQQGHEGTRLEPQANPDQIVYHRVKECSHCKSDLSKQNPQWTANTQVFDVPPIQLEVTEHRAEVKVCAQCGTTTRAPFPEGISGAIPAEYGTSIKGLALFLMHQHLIPVRRVAEILEEIFGRSISEGSLMEWAKQAFCELESFEKALIEQLTQSEVAHFDETGMRCQGKLHWLHSVSTAKLSFFGIHPKRGVEAMTALDVLPSFEGVAVHDHWKPYFRFESCVHALCNAHILRELTFIAEQLKESWAGRMNVTLHVISGNWSQIEGGGSAKHSGIKAGV
jgi:transposase